MKPNKKPQSTELQSSARVVDGKLILSLPDAISPVVWQMNLDDVSASALKVEEKTDSKTKSVSYALLMSAGKNEHTDIALNASRESAVAALMAASAAMENAQDRMPKNPGVHGMQYAAPPYQGPAVYGSSGSGKKKWILMGLAGLGVLVLLNIWASMQPVPPQSLQSASTGAPSADVPAQQQSGVPLSADAFLQDQ